MFSYHQFLVVVNGKINSEFPTIGNKIYNENKRKRCWCFYTFLFLSTVLLLATPFGTSADTFSGISGGNLGGSLGENFGGSEWIDTLGGSSAQLFVENNLNGSRGYGPPKPSYHEEKLGKRKLDQTDFDSSSAIFGIVMTAFCQPLTYFSRPIQQLLT
uniref:Uncharacterized protein n=1 Tax=Rhizophagus irregularis (strain DAOM 181602 / DAOM 197198 / MUCL 43194) TaxID=747089 RepID=U9T3U8_RHIID